MDIQPNPPGLTILDAPTHYSSEQASAWAAGVRAALAKRMTREQTLELLKLCGMLVDRINAEFEVVFAACEAGQRNEAI